MDDIDVCREIISLFFSCGSRRDIRECTIEVCKRHGSHRVPRNSEILAAASPEEQIVLRGILLVRPTRTLSGVAPVAVMTSPQPCPHGKCLPCPGGPDHPFASPQSYTGEEPAALRGRNHSYDPYTQVHGRIRQLEALGHHVGKSELIVMGGTITARPVGYQEWFVSECVRAMNDYPEKSEPSGITDFDVLASANESAKVRCVAITFETRPDWCLPDHIDRMLSLGVTKVELGVQHTDDKILDLNRRGCGFADTVLANRLLRDAGLKVGFHVMPNLPGSTIAADREMFREIFSNPSLRPDFLKIYPTLVTPGSEIESLYNSGEYLPYTEDDMIGLIAYAKSLLPEYVRLQRIQRDIPAKLILAGSRHSNFRQLAAARLREEGKECRCIRCREIGRRPGGPVIGEEVITYQCTGGTEYFISSNAGGSLVGFARLRFPGEIFRPELGDSALLRELHVYGSLVPVGNEPSADAHQHRNVGNRLLARAEETARDAGFTRIAVMAGIGVRPYYHRHGYERSGPYMIREIA